MGEHIMQNIRLTAAMSTFRGNYKYISDISDDVPVKTIVDYWREVPITRPYRPAGGYGSAEPDQVPEPRPRSAPCKFADQYHGSCIPKSTKSTAEKEAKPMTLGELREADVITQDKIWKENVHNEQKGLEHWKSQWSFLTEFDAKGNPIQKEPLPNETNRFSTGPLPNTNSGNYGSRTTTDTGKFISNLELKMSAPNRKKKLDSEMVCY